MDDNIITTGDHSPTYFSSIFNAYYHSVHGAWTETETVFIKAGLDYLSAARSHIDILEIGFGTGLNAFATLLRCHEKLSVSFTSLEKFPISSGSACDYAMKLNISEDQQQLFECLHRSPWESFTDITPSFKLRKHKIDFLEYRTDELFDLIYFDAFAPETQPELWDLPFFTYLYGLLRPGSVLTTYCAKGYVKRNIRSAGFLVESLPGPPGKREMTRAIKE